jgi:protein-S-isoprenylcysteine O-methyltransferase Ste14
MMARIGIMASRTGWVFMVVSVWIFVYRRRFREEDGLQQAQGEPYRTYRKAVPRFWPSLSPRVPSGGGQPRWGQAIVGEMIFWLFGVAILCFAVTLNIKWTGIVFATSFAFYFFVVGPLAKRRRTATMSS